MKFKFFAALFAALFVTGAVFAQGLNVGGVRITGDGISTGANTQAATGNKVEEGGNTDQDSMMMDNDSITVTSERGSVMIDKEGVAINTNSDEQGNCTVNGKSVPCDTIAKGAGLLLLITIFFFLIGLLLFIFWFVTLIHALTKPIENKIVWVIVIVFVPFGFILYYFIEMRPFNKKMMATYKAQNPGTPAQTEIK